MDMLETGIEISTTNHGILLLFFFFVKHLLSSHYGRKEKTIAHISKHFLNTKNRQRLKKLVIFTQVN